MQWFIGLAVFLLGISIIRGAPWLPTRKREAETAFRLLDLSPGETVIDLGSGSGWMLVAAAKRQLKAVGYEINPLLWLVSYLRTWPYRGQVKVILGDYWLRSLPPCDGVYVFLLDRYMERLEKKLQAELRSGAKLVSYVFTLPGSKPSLSEKGFHLYEF